MSAMMPLPSNTHTHANHTIHFTQQLVQLPQKEYFNSCTTVNNSCMAVVQCPETENSIHSIQYLQLWKIPEFPHSHWLPHRLTVIKHTATYNYNTATAGNAI